MVKQAGQNVNNIQLEELKKEVSPVLQQAEQIQVRTAEDFNYAGEFLKQLKGAQKRISNYWDGLIKPAYQHYKELLSRKKQWLQPLEKAETSVKRKMLAWKQEEERKRREEQIRLQQQAEERARREREKLLKRAEKVKTPEKKEEYLQKAEEVQAPIVTVEMEKPKVAGISTRKNWKAKVVDKKAFVEAALKDDNLMAFVLIDEKALNRVAKATKGNVKYPGIEFYEEEILAAGGK